MDHSSSLLPPHDEEPQENRRVVFFLCIALLFLIISASVGGLLFASSAGFKPGTILARLRSLTLAGEKMLRGESDDRANILLLGMGGPGHDGATLTDTMMLLSIRPSDHTVGLLSIPRDLQVKIPGYGYRKINSVNAYAEETHPGTGSSAAAAVVSDMLGQPIHYYLRVDFQAFKELIATVGGIDVDVAQTFYDPLYPDNNFGYAPVAFEAGQEHMNGDRALQFVRSRHGTSGEGNDFARARRQQKTLLALKERLLSFDVLLRPQRIKTIMDSLTSHLQTDIVFWEGVRLARIAKEVDLSHIINRVLDTSPDGVLVEHNYDGAFVLETKTGTWDEVRAVAAHLLEQTPIKNVVILNPDASGRGEESRGIARPPSPVGSGLISDRVSSGSSRDGEAPSIGGQASPTLPLVHDQPIIEIQNGTFTVGLAARTAAHLEELGFNPASIGNASLRNVEKTIVYDLTGGKKSEAFKKLKNTLQAIPGIGEPLHLISQSKLDFLVILGKNAMQ